jgi:hypothetical protein
MQKLKKPPPLHWTPFHPLAKSQREFFRESTTSYHEKMSETAIFSASENGGWNQDTAVPNQAGESAVSGRRTEKVGCDDQGVLI